MINSLVQGIHHLYRQFIVYVFGSPVFRGSGRDVYNFTGSFTAAEFHIPAFQRLFYLRQKSYGILMNKQGFHTVAGCHILGFLNLSAPG